ncbi:hypothetical protein EDC01DRAFT_190119 [Geopyxis carbonaria]|nr:hypothetical protein EDC01DRAFT_190119 [Geopyxis carbonaria]
MKLFNILTLLLPAALVHANTPMSDSAMQAALNNNNGFDIAFASRPIWHFGKSKGHKPCYPSPALINGAQHGTKPDRHPHAGTGCADPGPTGRSNPFPTYFTVTRCADDEVRVVYSLYFSHDGFSNDVIAKGHTHDWERIIVIWKRVNGVWTRKQLLKGFHSGYMEDNWATVQNTFNYDNTGENGGRNKDGAKIYVGWGKHAMFDDRNTGWNDAPSQGCSREFRSRDWWYLPDGEHLVAAGAGTEEGERIKSFDWGKADTSPPRAQEKVCAAKKGGFTAC